MTDQPPKPSLFMRLRSDIIAVVMVLLPLGVIGYLAFMAFQLIRGTILPAVMEVIGVTGGVLVPLISLVVLIALVWLVGVAARGAIGRRLTERLHGMMERLPGVGTLIGAVRQVADTALNKSDRNLKQTCLVEFPKPGTWSLGLISADPRGEIAARLPTGEEMLAVYIGLPPFTSAFLVYVPKKDVILLDMAADDEVRLLATAGIAYP